MFIKVNWVKSNPATAGRLYRVCREAFHTLPLIVAEGIGSPLLKGSIGVYWTLPTNGI